MARIAGVNIPTNKRVIIALTYIHGIGRTTAVQIADKLGIAHTARVQDLSDDEILRIRETIEPNAALRPAFEAGYDRFRAGLQGIRKRPARSI